MIDQPPPAIQSQTTPDVHVHALDGVGWLQVGYTSVLGVEDVFRCPHDFPDQGLESIRAGDSGLI